MKGMRYGLFVRFLIGVVGLVVVLGSAASADMLVAWRDSARVARYTDNWTYTGDFRTFASGVRVLNVVQDKSTGDVYVRTATGFGATDSSVVKYDYLGNLIPGWSVTGLSYGKGMAVRDGKIFISDGTAQTITWYSTTNSSVSGSLSSGSDAMGPVEALTFDSQGKLFAAGGSTIKRWDADLNYLGIVVGDSANLTDIKMMPGSDGIRALRWDGYLLGWDNDGVWTGPYYHHAPPPWPQALWISPTGEYFRSATGSSGGIQLLDTATGTWWTVVPEQGGYFYYPMGIADFQMIPEPGSVLVLGSGLLGALAFVRRRR